VVYGIVKEHKGDIQVYSEVGKGTAFTVRLPIMEEDAAGDILEVDVQPLPTGSESILLVDDEPAIANLERQMLERLGYRVSVRTSSTEALYAFQANPGEYQLVVSDMSMPGMTGIQLAGEMRAIDPAQPVILCTGFSEKLSRIKLKAMDINGFLMKPIVKAELAKTVRKVLDESIIGNQG
jgi:CheY-like chemotaxis protein